MEVMRHVLLWRLWSFRNLLEVMEAMRRVLLCDGGDALCAALYTGDCGGWDRFVRGDGGDGGDAPCAALYAGGCSGWDRFVRGDGGDGGDALHVTLHAGGCRVFEICWM